MFHIRQDKHLEVQELQKHRSNTCGGEGEQVLYKLYHLVLTSITT